MIPNLRHHHHHHHLHLPNLLLSQLLPRHHCQYRSLHLHRHLLTSQNNNSTCPSAHSNEYCSQYWLGYNDEWSRSVSINDNTDQNQGASVNIKGNGNHVQINQGKLSTDSGFSGSNSHSSSHDRTLNACLYTWE
jgi:hypothetical protein